MHLPKPNFTPTNYIGDHGEHAFMDLSDYNEKKPLKLYRSDKDENKLRDRKIMFYGTDLRGIQPYIKYNTYYEWTLFEEDKNSLFDLTDIENQKTLNEKLKQKDIDEIKKAFFKTSLSIEKQKDINEDQVFFESGTDLKELKKEKEHYLENENNILYVRKSDDVNDDIEFVKIMKKLLPKYKGTYTKCLKPLFGDSLSHAEVIIWDKELNEKLFGSGEMKRANSSSSSQYYSAPSPYSSPHGSPYSSPQPNQSSPQLFMTPPSKRQRLDGGYLNSKTIKKKRQNTQKRQRTNNSKTIKKKKQNRLRTKVSNKLKTLKKMRQRTQRNTRTKKTKILKKNR